ncbi:MAG: twin-arginine translocation signal domain-containing protein [Prevotellaceae bacterium]|jgi:L-alanine-DL-glutamate epimerase-like enolase superfamily enzyme|nr:twin-arginine translocation signal domain-containing protein [Prevotellaceae bacterium]
MEQSRRNFLKTAALATAGTGLLLNGTGAKLFASPKPRRPLPGSAKMKFTFRPVDLQLKYTFTVATFSRTMTPSVQAEIEYDGVTGYGEAAMPQYLGESSESVMAFLKRVNLEQFRSPFEMDDILNYVDSITENNTAAKALVDIALHDLVGKLMGQPWYKIWGLNIDKIPHTTYTIGIDEPETVRKKTREYVNDFKILKVKLGGSNDREMINTIREVTDLPLAIDANQGWKDKHYALDMIHWLKEKGIVLIEQPMSKKKLDDIAWITQNSPLPVFADESLQRLSDIMKLKDAFNGINIKLMKCTGMREAWKMINMARALDLKIMIGCMTETSCAISAAAQLSPAVDFCDLDGNLLIAPTADLYKGATLQNGKMMPTDLPGIGIVKK